MINKAMHKAMYLFVIKKNIFTFFIIINNKSR